MGCASVCSQKILHNATRRIELSSIDELSDESQYETIFSDEDDAKNPLTDRNEEEKADFFDSSDKIDSSFLNQTQKSQKSAKEPSISIMEITHRRSNKKKTSVSRILNSKGTLNSKMQRCNITHKSSRSILVPRNPRYGNTPRKLRNIAETRHIIRHKNMIGMKMINEYCILRTLGQGSYAKVKLATRPIKGKEMKFAIKIFKKSYLKKKRKLIKDSNGKMKYKDFLYKVQREVAVMKKLNHPNIIKLYEVLDNPEDDKIYMGKFTIKKLWSMLREGTFLSGTQSPTSST